MADESTVKQGQSALEITDKSKRGQKPKLNGSVPATMEDTPAATAAQHNSLMFTHVVKDKPLATLENLRDLFNARGIRCRYNVTSKRIMFSIPNESFSMENGDEVALALIYSYIKQVEMPVDGYKGYVLRIADENQYNPVMQWITSKPWDGISRIPQLCDTIESSEPEAKNLLLRRWLITAVCMAKGEGVDSAGCIVLQGATDIGKTWWVKKLVPPELRKELIRTDATVNPHDKDSVSQIISYWICELGEIGATFVKSELQALKTFITRENDIMRRPYGEGDKRYPRRTALIASVDQMIFLHDTAGNRRFWTIPCTTINSYHDIDMQQLWAEVLDLTITKYDPKTLGADGLPTKDSVVTREAETWQLAPDEKGHINRINEKHMQIDPIEELIVDMYFSQPATTASWVTATEIAIKIGLKNVTQKETRAIAGAVRKWNKNNKDKEKFSSGLKFFVPTPRI